MYLWLLDPANWFLPISAAVVRDNKGATTMTDSANIDIAIATDIARSLEADLDTFRATITNMTTFADKIATRIATAIANASELATTVAAMSGEIAALRSQVEELSDRVADRDAIAAERDELVVDRDNLRSERDELVAKLRAEQETSKRHWDNLTEANATLDAARTSLTAREQELSYSQRDLTDAHSRIEELNRELVDRQNYNATLDATLESVRQEYAAYREQTTILADDLRSQVETANGKVVEAEAASQARVERLIELGEEVARIRADFETLNSTRLDEIRALTDDRDNLRSVLATIMAAVNGVSSVLAPKPEPVPVDEVKGYEGDVVNF